MDSSTDRPPVSLGGFFHLGVVYVVWGSTYLAIRIAVREGAGFPPFMLGTLRLATAGAALFGWAALRRMPLRLSRSDAATLVLSSLLLWPAANGLENWAEQRVDSGYAALLFGAIPIWAAGIEALLERRRPTWRLAASLFVGFAGLGLLTAPRLVGAAGADVLSILALIVAPITWAAGSILQARRPVRVSPLVSAGYLHVFGFVGFLACALAMREPLPTPSLEAWGAWVYLVVAGSILAFTSYVRMLRLLPMSVAMTFAYVNPVIAVFLGAILLQERITLPILAGMALILVGVWGVFHEKYRRAAPLSS